MYYVLAYPAPDPRHANTGRGASGSGEGDPSDDRGVRRGVRSEGCGGVLPLRAEGGAEGTPPYVRGPTVPLR